MFITKQQEGQITKTSSIALWSELRPVPEWAVRRMVHTGLGFHNSEKRK